jgi:hypothetical protein
MPSFPETRTVKGTRIAKVAGWSPPGVTVSTDFFYDVSFNGSSSGGKNPNWRDTIAGGGDATNNYDAMYPSASPGGISVSASPASTGDSVSYNGWLPNLMPYTSIDSTVVGKLIGEATVRSLANARSSFSAGTALGELREALTMLRHPANGLRKLTDSYVKRAQAYRYEWLRSGMSRQKLRDISKALPDLYLEFQFGWKPLAADITSAVDAVGRTAAKPKFVKIRGSAHSDVTLPKFDSAIYNNFPTSAYQLRGEREVNINYSVRIRGAASLKLGFGMPAFQAGSTIPDMIPTLWNLAPWSFLIDYFSNVGEVLEARATASLITLNWGCISEKHTLNTKNTIYFVGGPSRATHASKCVHVKRRKMSAGFPIPDIAFDEVPTKGQSMNIAALVASKLADFTFATVHPNTYSH